MKHGILMHEADDDVGVAVEELRAGTQIGAVTLEGTPVVALTIVEDVPLGHKVAMRDIAAEKDVVEYGRVIAVAVHAAPRGSHVHTHNIRTKRWTA